MLRNFHVRFQRFFVVKGYSTRHSRDMNDDPTASKMIGQLARGWAQDKYRRNKKFHKQVLYEVLDKCVGHLRETGENETDAITEAAETFGVSESTVSRARREIRKMRSTVKTAAS
jgi:hypothetical protein